MFFNTVACFTRRILLCLVLMVFCISCARSGKFASKILKGVKSRKIGTGEVVLPPFGVGNLVLLQAM